jgi:LmbE family N-acetylglucosaminyl deacetylase
MNSSEIMAALKKLNTIGNALYIAAHPDDENTAVLSYLSTGLSLRTAYLSITRGDGGQNLIGSEQDELLGIIRTGELLEARKIDGAEQFFTRAIDFGYSKSPEETFNVWDKQAVLSDVVWIIRTFKPDIIISRFPLTGGGHGQHTASAILAEEAFKLAGNPNAFPEQLKYTSVWQPKKLFWNGWLQAIEQSGTSSSDIIMIDAGKFNPILGLSYTEIAALSRSMHKSQGFGSSARRGESINYFKNLSGNETSTSLLDGINLSWQRVPDSERIEKKILDAINFYNPEKPSLIIPYLLDAYDEMQKIDNNFWIAQKKKEIVEIIRACAGIWIEAISSDPSAVKGEQVKILSGIVNRSDIPIKLKSVNVNTETLPAEKNILLEKNKFISTEHSISIPHELPFTHPYWLEEEADKGMYQVKNQFNIGKPQTKPPLEISFMTEINGIEIPFTTPLFFRWTDPVEGEMYRPFEITPEVTINFGSNLYLFPVDSEKTISVTVKSHSDSVKGILKLKKCNGWTITPDSYSFNFDKKNDETIFSFRIIPPKSDNECLLTAQADINGKISSRSLIEINYPHIPRQQIFPAAKSKLLKFNNKRVISKIGYLMGSGDDLPYYLKQLGYEITLLSDQQVENNGLNNFEAIITGIRAYNTRDRLAVYHQKLLEYVKKGGTLLVQYNVNRGLKLERIGPHPFTISRDRVTVEDSPVYFEDESHQLLNFPNKINKKDFDGWVQERGLYFAQNWSTEYETIISFADPGEPALNGGLLYCKYGKGTFIYTGLAFFRQIPAGISGAIRFFNNLISSGNYGKEKHFSN